MSNKKMSLYDAVKECRTPKYIVIGALSKAGLLAQYREEEAKHETEVLKPSITEKQLDKIIKDFIG